MTLDARQIEYALTHKGFVRENAKHHVMFWFYLDGKKTSVRTRLSFGVTEIGDRLISCMSREMRITKADFLRFVECGMSGDEYKTKLISDGQVQR